MSLVHKFLFYVLQLKLRVLQSYHKETFHAICWGSKSTCYWSWCFTCQFLQCSGEKISHFSWSECIKLFGSFFLYLSMILFYPLVSVSHLAVLYPTSRTLLCKFPFHGVESSRKFWVQCAEPPLCWYLGILKSSWLHTLGILRSWSFSFWNKEFLVMSGLFHILCNLNWLNLSSVWSRVIFYDQYFHNVITTYKNKVAFVTLSFDLVVFPWMPLAQELGMKSMGLCFAVVLCNL